MMFHTSNIEPEFDALVAAFPDVFMTPSERVLEIFNTNNGQNVPTHEDDLCNLRYGFEHDSGWIEILKEFLNQATMLVNEEHAEGREAEFTSFIVKEKLGALEWQGNCSFESEAAGAEFYELVSDLWEKSLTTCEVTGKVGKLRTTKDGWKKTLCDEQAEKLGYE